MGFHACKKQQIYPEKNRAKSKQLSEDEQNLLVKYRELSAKEKNAVIGLCDLLINH